MLLCLDKGPVGRRYVAGTRPNAHGGLGIGERPRHDVVAAPLELFVVFQRAPVEDLHVLLGEAADLLFVDIDQAKVLHLNSPFVAKTVGTPLVAARLSKSTAMRCRNFSGRSVDSRSRAPTIGRDEAATAHASHRRELADAMRLEVSPLPTAASRRRGESPWKR